MPDPPHPQTPNYTYGQGQLVVFRDDFQDHIDGQGFRHNATQIDLSPGLTIGGNPITDVQDAITALNNIVEPPSIAPATSTSLGTVQLSLSGDVQGTATNLQVTGIRGYAVNTSPPSLNNVLTWNGSAYTPSPAQGVFTAGGNLAGSNTSQQVIGLTGDSTTNPGFDTTVIACDYLQFTSTRIPNITQALVPSGIGTNFKISAQTSISGNGGNLIMQGGAGSTLVGSTMININGLGTAIQAGSAVNGQNVVAFFSIAGLTTAQMPANSGDRVLYVANANVNPIAAPGNGATVYATGGQLWVMQQDGNNFRVGGISNPNIWGALSSTSGETIEYRSSAQAAAGGPGQNVFSVPFVFPNNTAVYITCLFSAKEVAGSPSAYAGTFNMGFWISGSGGVTNIGTLTDTDVRNVGAASWTAPVITSAGSNLVVKTGYSGSNISNWIVTTKIVISPQG